MSKLTTITLDSRTWNRGNEETGDVALRNEDGRCCLGFACEQLGIPWQYTRGCDSPEMCLNYMSRDSNGFPRKVDSKLVQILKRFLRGSHNNATTNHLMQINDEQGTDDAERVAALNKRAHRIGLKFVLRK